MSTDMKKRATVEAMRLTRKEAVAAGAGALMAILSAAPFARVKIPKPIFVITIRCRDGESVSLAIHETPWGTLSTSPTAAGRKVAAVIGNYRPARQSPASRLLQHEAV